ncbi:MAG: PhoH family protein, partial [Bacteroidales bacterium]|nr:PhoH family protein [Bacteroidales bacterium]
VESANHNDMVFAIGPAGTGKTYTAVALAVRALKNKQIRRIILTRPAVEAGENLGFLPGDLRDKLDPYLQPLYDALRDMMPMQKLLSYLEDKTVEIAPLAFMRGRTLDNAYVILDEAQNATDSQIKMFLTRMGKNAKFFITGDITQVDLPRRQQSGLILATKILKDVKGIDFIYLDNADVVRHHLVTKIIKCYEQWENRKEERADNRAEDDVKDE